jgi:rubredoxin
MIVTCPVCGSDAQGKSEDVYHQEWDHRTNPPSYSVLKQRGHRCGNCGRIYTTDHGDPLDGDLVAAMRASVSTPKRGQPTGQWAEFGLDDGDDADPWA